MPKEEKKEEVQNNLELPGYIWSEKPEEDWGEIRTNWFNVNSAYNPSMSPLGSALAYIFMKILIQLGILL